MRVIERVEDSHVTVHTQSGLARKFRTNSAHTLIDKMSGCRAIFIVNSTGIKRPMNETHWCVAKLGSDNAEEK